MREVKRYKCDFCRKLLVDYNRMELHEKTCIHNPESINCYRCTHAYIGDIVEDNGLYSQTYKDMAICDITEEMLAKNEAIDCEQFQRAEDMYFNRTGEYSSSLF